MEIQKNKEAFEKFCFDQFLMSPSDGCFELEDDGFYESLETHRLWVLWQLKTKAQTIPEGFVLVNAESLALHAQSIRMFNNGEEEEDYYEIENHVCAIEAMIEAQEQSHECQNP